MQNKNLTFPIIDILLFVLLIVLPCSTEMISTDSIRLIQKPVIKNIIIDGNKKTKEKIILLFINIAIGDIYDTSKIRIAEERLNESKLFNHVKIFPIINRERVNLLVIVREKNYLSLGNFGAILYDKKYRYDTDWYWLQVYVGINNTNFLGRNENISLSASIWSTRHIGLSWSKQFITKPFFINIGTVIGDKTSTVSGWHTDFYNNSYISFGSKLWKTSRVYTTFNGTYKRYEWAGENGFLLINNAWIAKRTKDISLPEHLTFLKEKMQMDSDWEYTHIQKNIEDDSTIIKTTTYKWKGEHSKVIEYYERNLTEAHITIGFSTDHRNRRFNTNKGFYFKTSLTTNAPYPYRKPIIDKTTDDWNIIGEEKITHLISYTDFRLFHRGIWKNNIVAYRFRPSLTLYGEGNVYRGMYMGNEYSLRGYSTGAFGGSTFNDRFLFSLEYRFRIAKLPFINFSRFKPLLSWYINDLDKLPIVIDGTLILDCGHIWKEFASPLSSDAGYATGAGTGIGLRILFPSIKRTINIELVWPIYPSNNFKFKNVSWYFYLDFPF